LNKYNHYNGDGGAYNDVYLNDGESATGAFYFPALGQDVTSITYMDDDQGKSIGPIEVRH
jgi:hypothetical protein